MDDGGRGDGGGHGDGQVEEMMRTVEVMKMGTMAAEEGMGLEKT